MKINGRTVASWLAGLLGLSLTVYTCYLNLHYHPNFGLISMLREYKYIYTVIIVSFITSFVLSDG